MARLFRTARDEEEFRRRYQEILRRWPIANEHLRIPTSQGETFVVASGNGPPLILLHGALSNSAAWIGEVATWANDFRVYAVDVIGEPGLSAPSRPPLAGEAHANWLDDVLRGLGIERAAFVGVSLGGWLALDFAIRRSARVRSLALLCPGGVGRQRPGLLFKVLPLLLLGLTRQAQEYALGCKLDVPAEFAAFLDFIQRRFRARYQKLPVFSDADLQKLTMPLLAIVGGRDVMLDSAATKRRLEAIGADVRWLPHCGHLITGQAATIRTFLISAAGRRPNTHAHRV